MSASSAEVDQPATSPARFGVNGVNMYAMVRRANRDPGGWAAMALGPL